MPIKKINSVNSKQAQLFAPKHSETNTDLPLTEFVLYNLFLTGE